VGVGGESLAGACSFAAGRLGRSSYSALRNEVACDLSGVACCLAGGGAELQRQRTSKCTWVHGSPLKYSTVGLCSIGASKQSL
jgi:hypothetical protein